MRLALQLGVSLPYVHDRLQFSNGAPTLHVERDGFVGGGHLGYNFQRGAIVFGVEGDFEGADLHKHVRSPAGITSEGAIDSDWEGSIRGRPARCFMPPRAQHLPG